MRESFRLLYYRSCCLFLFIFLFLPVAERSRASCFWTFINYCSFLFDRVRIIFLFCCFFFLRKCFAPLPLKEKNSFVFVQELFPFFVLYQFFCFLLFLVRTSSSSSLSHSATKNKKKKKKNQLLVIVEPFCHLASCCFRSLFFVYLIKVSVFISWPGSQIIKKRFLEFLRIFLFIVANLSRTGALQNILLT